MTESFWDQLVLFIEVWHPPEKVRRFQKKNLNCVFLEK